jgi:hypothetical protein
MNKRIEVVARSSGKCENPARSSARRLAVRGDDLAPGSEPRSEERRTTTPSACTLLATPGALLSRSHLRELWLERRAVDAVFRACDVVVLPGYSRPLVRVADYLALLERSTHDGATRVR